MNPNLTKVINSMAEDILSMVHLIIGEQGLSDSALNEDIQYTIDTSNNPVIKLFFNDYLEYIETGRRNNAELMPPISELREWAIRKGIPPTNDILYAIAQSIKQEGITPRPILALLEKRIEESFANNSADDLFEAIISQISDYFNE